MELWRAQSQGQAKPSNTRWSSLGKGRAPNKPTLSPQNTTRKSEYVAVFWGIIYCCFLDEEESFFEILLKVLTDVFFSAVKIPFFFCLHLSLPVTLTIVKVVIWKCAMFSYQKITILFRQQCWKDEPYRHYFLLLNTLIPCLFWQQSAKPTFP